MTTTRISPTARRTTAKSTPASVPITWRPPISLWSNSPIQTGLPKLFAPDGSTTLTVAIEPYAANPLPDSAQLIYSTGDDWITLPMTMIDTNVYEVAAPALTCDAKVQYYFNVPTSSGIDATDPPHGPFNTYSARSAYGLVFAFADDCETDQGWIIENGPNLTAGAWERGVPAGDGTRGDPTSDYDHSGSCYLTENADGDSDVDNGYSWLISPAFDLSNNDAHVAYALWYSNNAGADPNNEQFFVHVSNDDGNTWQLVHEHGPVSETGWNEFNFRVSDYVELTDSIRVRFEVSDFGNPSIVEAAVDNIRIERSACEPFAAGDMDCNLVVNFDDINGFVLALVGAADYAAEYPFCNHLNGDFNDDQVVNFDDIELFVGAMAGE